MSLLFGQCSLHNWWTFAMQSKDPFSIRTKVERWGREGVGKVGCCITQHYKELSRIDNEIHSLCVPFYLFADVPAFHTSMFCTSLLVFLVPLPPFIAIILPFFLCLQWLKRVFDFPSHETCGAIYRIVGIFLKKVHDDLRIILQKQSNVSEFELDFHKHFDDGMLWANNM